MYQHMSVFTPLLTGTQVLEFGENRFKNIICPHFQEARCYTRLIKRSLEYKKVNLLLHYF